jgi:RNA polymerase sigma factor (sigma-70 family)
LRGPPEDPLLDLVQLQLGGFRPPISQELDDVVEVGHHRLIRTSGPIPDKRVQKHMRDDEFERLYAAEAQGLFAFLAYRTGDRTLAEDLLADAFERALRARRRFNPARGSQKTWLYAIALNVLRDHVRRAAAESRAYARAGDPGGSPDRLAAVEQRDELARALATLSAEEREAIALRFGAELTMPELAELLGERLTTVEGRVYRALRKLRDELH